MGCTERRAHEGTVDAFDVMHTAHFHHHSDAESLMKNEERKRFGDESRPIMQSLLR